MKYIESRGSCQLVIPSALSLVIGQDSQSISLSCSMVWHEAVHRQTSNTVTRGFSWTPAPARKPTTDFVSSDGEQVASRNKGIQAKKKEMRFGIFGVPRLGRQIVRGDRPHVYMTTDDRVLPATRHTLRPQEWSEILQVLIGRIPFIFDK